MWIFLEADTLGGLLPCRPFLSKYYKRGDITIFEELVRGETMWNLLLSTKDKGADMVPGLGRLAAINYAMIDSIFLQRYRSCEKMIPNIIFTLL